MKIKKLFSTNKKLQNRIFREEISREGEIVELIETGLDVLEYFSNKNLEEYEEAAIPILELVGRLQKTIQSVIILCLNGQGLVGTALLRDVVEIEYLLEYFRMQPEMMKVWWESDRTTRWNKFRPNILREKIAGCDTKLKSKMDADYQVYSDLLSHPSPNSLALQKGMKIKVEKHNHPYDFTAIRICLTKTAFQTYSVSRLICLYGFLLSNDKKFDVFAQKLDSLSKRFKIYNLISAVLLENRLETFENYLKTNYGQK